MSGLWAFLTRQKADDLYQALSGYDVNVGCRVRASTPQTITTATETLLLWDTEDYDDGGFHSNVTNTGRLTVPTDGGGRYHVSLNASFSTGTTGVRGCSIRKNGTKIADLLGPASPAYGTRMHVSTDIDAVATDYFEAMVYHEQGSDLTVDNNAVRHHFECHRTGLAP